MLGAPANIVEAEGVEAEEPGPTFMLGDIPTEEICHDLKIYLKTKSGIVQTADLKI